MESLLETVKAMGKASYREIAARLDIDPVEAIKLLREQRDLGACGFSDGGWFVVDAKKNMPAPAPKHQAPRLMGEQPQPVNPDTVCQLITQHGPMTTAALAECVNRNSRGMVSVLRSLARRGVIVQVGKGDGVTWTLPATPVEEATEPDTTQPEKTTAELVSDIPAFVIRPDDLLIPTVSGLSREIRRTKQKLAGLERLRAAVREYKRNLHHMEQRL